MLKTKSSVATAGLTVALRLALMLISCSSSTAAQFVPIKLMSIGAADSPVVTALAYSEQQTTLAVGGDDHSIQIIQMSDNTVYHVLWHHQDWIKSLDYSDDGKYLLSAGDDGNVSTWKCSDYTVSSSRKLVPHPIFSARYSHQTTNGLNDIAFVGFSRNLYTGVQEPLIHSQAMPGVELRTLAIARNGKQFATAGNDGKIYIVDQSTLVAEVVAHTKRVWQVAYMPGDQALISCAEDGTLALSDLVSRQVIARVTIPHCKLRSLAVLSSRYVATAGSDNHIYIVDMQRQMSVLRLDGHTGTVCALQKCGATLASGSYDSTLLLWNIEAFQ